MRNFQLFSPSTYMCTMHLCPHAYYLNLNVFCFSTNMLGYPTSKYTHQVYMLSFVGQEHHDLHVNSSIMDEACSTEYNPP